MKDIFDKNGKLIECGMDVEMPEPREDGSDIWTVGNFVAMVDDILDDEILVVSDQEGDFFEVESNRVEIV